jgi:hypothetical protein
MIHLSMKIHTKADYLRLSKMSPKVVDIAVKMSNSIYEMLSNSNIK